MENTHQTDLLANQVAEAIDNEDWDTFREASTELAETVTTDGRPADSVTFEGARVSTNNNFQSSAIEKMEFFMTSPSDSEGELAVLRYLKDHGTHPTGDIRVHFANGRVYLYEDVPFDLFLTVAEASSPGKQFQIHLRDRDCNREA